jgi:hypothetical protein
VLARLALAQDAEAGNAAAALSAAMREAGVTRTWSYRCAVELAALARARQGRAAEASRQLAELDAGAPIAPLSPVEEAESLLRRAEVYRSAGRGSDSGAAIRRALELLAGQDAQSPRLAEANRLLAGSPKPTPG